MSPTLRRALATLRDTPGATLSRCVFGRRWRDVLIVNGHVTRLPIDTIHKLKMALAVREAGGACKWTRVWVAVT